MMYFVLTHLSPCLDDSKLLHSGCAFTVELCWGALANLQFGK